MKNLILIISILVLIGLSSAAYVYSKKNTTHNNLAFESIPITVTKNSNSKLNFKNCVKNCAQTNSKNSNTTFSPDSLFTESYVNTLYLLEQHNGSSLSGNIAILSNINYYSIVNGEKYYVVYQSIIPAINYFDTGNLPIASSGNYSGVSNPIYMNATGNTISRQQFLNGQKSFHVSNLTSQEIYNQIYRLALEYKYGPITPSNYKNINNARNSNNFNLNGLTYKSNNLIVDTNVSVIINGQTFYQVSYIKNQPFYISITGNVYVPQESTLASIFNVPISNNQAEPTGTL